MLIKSLYLNKAILKMHLTSFRGDRMTQKYLAVRREIYEKNPASRMNTSRSFSDMVKLFKRPYWIILAALAISIIGLALIFIFAHESSLVWIPLIIMVIASLCSQIPRERFLYKERARQKELLQVKENYTQYISETLTLLKNQNIDKPEKIIQIKLECEAELKTQEEKYNKISSRVFDMLIGVPLGALIASIIATDGNVEPTAIICIVVIGIVISGIAKLIQLVGFYSEGYFKDRYLLDALNELSYSDFIYNNDLEEKGDQII